MSKVEASDYFSIKRVTSIEAKGNFVVWDEKVPDKIENSYNSTLKLLDKTTGEIREFTSGKKMDFQPKFSPNGKYLAFISTRYEKPQIFIIRLDGGEARQLTKSKNGVLGFDWAPKSDSIAFTSMTDPNEEETIEKPETKFDKERMKAEDEEKERKLKDPRVITRLIYRQGTSYNHPDRFSHVFIIKIEEKEAKRISDGYYHHSNPVFVDENHVISTSKRELPLDLSTKVSLVKFDINDTSEGEIITDYRSYWPAPPIAKTMNNCFVSMMDEGTPAGANTKWGIVREDSVEIINNELDRSVGNIKILENGKIFITVEDTGKADIREYNPETKEFIKIFETHHSIIDYTTETGNEIYFTATSATKVWAVWKWTKENGVELIEDPNKDGISSKSIIEPEEIWFTNPEGVKFQGWYFDASKLEHVSDKPGLVLSIHGGPHVMWTDGGTMMHEWQTTVNAGYSVLALNPIGSQGYGQAFSQKIVPRKWGLDDARDLLLAVDEISERIDKERMYVTGGSYAGFQTANLITRDHRFKAAVAQRGVYNFVNFGFVTDIPLWFGWEMGGIPHDSKEMLQDLWEKSPLGRAKEIQTPLLIIHAENDFRVPISEAESLFASLKLQDKEVVFVRYPRDGHELSRSGEPLHVVDRIERMIDWFDTHK